jgi:hypothetical protein
MRDGMMIMPLIRADKLIIYVLIFYHWYGGVYSRSFACRISNFSLKRSYSFGRKLNFSARKMSFSGRKSNFPGRKMTFSARNMKFSGRKLNFSVRKMTFSGRKRAFPARIVTDWEPALILPAGKMKPVFRNRFISLSRYSDLKTVSCGQRTGKHISSGNSSPVGMLRIQGI